jgi:alkanesulfonate monooxygenase SsuD/methylene tetrahydromethanopterin reductase-like flavin-dependent oxidoreductase (luciferase family)
MTLRAVARLANACNLVRGDIAEVRNKLAVLRGHCDAAGRDYDTIEKTHVQRWVLARDDARASARREQLAARGVSSGFVGTVSKAIDLVGQFRDAGIDVLIISDQRNDAESRELFVSDVMPHFA